MGDRMSREEVAASGERWHMTCNPIPRPCVLKARTQELETDMFDKRDTGSDNAKMKGRLVFQIPYEIVKRPASTNGQHDTQHVDRQMRQNSNCD